MSMQDLVSDFVARINNAVMIDRSSVIVLKNKIVLNLCKKLVKLGYFVNFQEEERTLIVEINLEKIKKITRISKPGQRIYVSYGDLPRIINGIGWNILSTSGGIKTNFEARRDKLGGELVMQIIGH
jgi:small subunit ribosomal protein S8